MSCLRGGECEGVFVTGRVEQHTSPGDGDSPPLADSGGRLLAIIRPSNFVPRALFSSSSHQHSLGLRDLRDLHMRSGQWGPGGFCLTISLTIS